MVAAGEIRGKALKGKGKDDREVRSGGDSLVTDEETRPGCSTVVGVPAEEGDTRMGPCSE